MAQVAVLIQTLEVLACVGDIERGLRLASSAQRAREVYGYRYRAPLVEERLAARTAEAHTTLGDRADDLWREGEALDLHDAATYALRGHTSRDRPSFGWDSLTPTEVAVVDLVAEGLTNPPIAERLLVGTSTVKTHGHHIFTKLGIRTRAELAATVIANRADERAT